MNRTNLSFYPTFFHRGTMLLRSVCIQSLNRFEVKVEGKCKKFTFVKISKC
jgi:hypothetical protein